MHKYKGLKYGINLELSSVLIFEFFKGVRGEKILLLVEDWEASLLLLHRGLGRYAGLASILYFSNQTSDRSNQQI